MAKTKIPEYRPSDIMEDGTPNFVRTGDIVKVKIGKKNAFLAEVRSIDSIDGKTPTDIEVIVRGNCQGAPHGQQGRVRYVTAENITRVAQTKWGHLRSASKAVA